MMERSFGGGGAEVRMIFIFQVSLASTARRLLVLRIALLLETHLLETGNARFGRGAVLLREACGTLRGGLVHQLFVEAQMCVGDDRGADRLGVGGANLDGDLLRHGVDPLRRIHAGLGDFFASPGGERGVILRLMGRVDAENFRKGRLIEPLSVGPVFQGGQAGIVGVQLILDPARQLEVRGEIELVVTGRGWERGLAEIILRLAVQHRREIGFRHLVLADLQLLGAVLRRRGWIGAGGLRRFSRTCRRSFALLTGGAMPYRSGIGLMEVPTRLRSRWRRRRCARWCR